MLVLKTFPDELNQILGDSEPPYAGTISSDDEPINPTIEDRTFCSSITFAPPQQPEIKPPLVHYGLKYAIKSIYNSVYPSDIINNNCLSLCDRCLEFYNSDFTLSRHLLKCPFVTPPGAEIYRDKNNNGAEVSVYEVDGARATRFCQNLCSLAKLFLESKALHREVQPFLFYVLVVNQSIVGYFSKQKLFAQVSMPSPIQQVSCIVVLAFAPPNSGQFLIELSYLMAKHQHTTGEPEKPLSKLGERAFRRFWKQRMAELLLANNFKVSIHQLCEESGICIQDVITGLEDLGVVRERKGTLTLDINPELLTSMRGWPFRVDPSKLLWAPLAEYED